MGDKYEQEADRVARQVVNAPAPMLPVAQRLAKENKLNAKELTPTITPLVQREAMLDEEEIQREGAHPPGNAGEQELIAHELTHEVQQTGGAGVQSPIQPVSASPANGLEGGRASNTSVQR